MAFIRVKDPDTRHEFDVDEDSVLLRRGLVEHVKPKLYPPARYPRRPKYHLNLAAPARQDVAASASDEPIPTEENENG